MSELFKKLHHICIVVKDLDATVSYYERLGVGPWFDYPKSGSYVEFEVPNQEASKAMRYKCVNLDNVQIQLCEPGTLDSPQARFLRERGEGVYHLGFEAADMAQAEAQGKTLGLDVIARGRREDGGGFCYYDTRDKAGTVLEVRK